MLAVPPVSGAITLASLAERLRRECQEWDRLWQQVWGDEAWGLSESEDRPGSTAGHGDGRPSSDSENLRHKQGRPHLRLVSDTGAPDEGSIDGAS